MRILYNLKQTKEEEELEEIGKQQYRALEKVALWGNKQYDFKNLAKIIGDYADFDKREEKLIMQMTRIKTVMQREAKVDRDMPFLKNERVVIRGQAWLAKYQQWQKKYQQWEEKYQPSQQEEQQQQQQQKKKNRTEELKKVAEELKKVEEEYQRKIVENKQRIKGIRYIYYPFAWILVKIDNICRFREDIRCNGWDRSVTSSLPSEVLDV